MNPQILLRFPAEHSHQPPRICHIYLITLFRRTMPVAGYHFVLQFFYEMNIHDILLLLPGKLQNRFGLTDLTRPFDNKRALMFAMLPFLPKGSNVSF